MALCAAFGLVLPIGILVVCGYREGTRWIQNCPSVTVYVPLLLPIAAGELVDSIWSNGLLGMQKWWLVGTAAAILALLITALTAAYNDFITIDALPFVLRADGVDGEGLELERQLRARNATADHRKQVRVKYGKIVGPFGSFAGARERGGWLIYPLLLQSFLGATVIAFLFSYSCLVVLRKSNAVDYGLTVSQLSIVFGVLVLWLPLRLFSNWYQLAHYRSDWVGSQKVLWVLAIVAVIIAIILWLLPNADHGAKIMVSAVSLVMAAAGLAKGFGWSSALKFARDTAQFLADLPGIYVVAVYMCLLGLVLTIALLGLHLGNK